MDRSLGMCVHIRFTEAWASLETVLRNVTEIHYLYPGYQERVAFESDVHGTGTTYERDVIAEFEAKVETEVAEAFS